MRFLKLTGVRKDRKYATHHAARHHFIDRVKAGCPAKGLVIYVVAYVTILTTLLKRVSHISKIEETGDKSEREKSWNFDSSRNSPEKRALFETLSPPVDSYFSFVSSVSSNLNNEITLAPRSFSRSFHQTETDNEFCTTVNYANESSTPFTSICTT